MRLGLGLGLGFSQKKTTGINNPLLDLDNVSVYYDFTDQTKYTFTGSDVDSVAPVTGAANMDHSVGTKATYDATNGLVAAATTTGYVMDDSYATDASMAIVLVGFLPSSAGTAREDWLSQGVSASSTNTAALKIDSAPEAGSVRYFTNQAGAAESFTAATLNAQNVIILNYNSASDCDVYINNTTAQNFDPNNNYSTRDRMYLFNAGLGNDAIVDSSVKYLVRTSDVLTTEEITAIMGAFA